MLININSEANFSPGGLRLDMLEQENNTKPLSSDELSSNANRKKFVLICIGGRTKHRGLNCAVGGFKLNTRKISELAGKGSEVRDRYPGKGQKFHHRMAAIISPFRCSRSCFGKRHLDGLCMSISPDILCGVFFQFEVFVPNPLSCLSEAGSAQQNLASL